jgi:dUTP pyrophosphatase
MAYLQIKLTSNTAIIPRRGTEYSAGYDLSASEDKMIPARGRAMVDTGISVAFPSDHYLRIAPRSGLALKKGLDVGAGVVDSDYRSTIRVILFNHTNDPYYVKQGDRIAQAILVKISTPEIEIVDELSSTERGFGGFGSTGNA